MPAPRKYADETEKRQARALQEKQRRDARAPATKAPPGRPAKYDNAAEAQAARNERRRLRRKSDGVALQEVTDTPAQSNDAATDNQQPAPKVQDTQDFLVNQLEDLSIASVIPGDETQEKQADRLQQPSVMGSPDEGSSNLLTLTSDVTQPKLLQQTETTD
jgi:hypothetical protein